MNCLPPLMKPSHWLSGSTEGYRLAVVRGDAKIRQPPAFGEIRLGSCHLLLLNQASLISLSPWKLGEPLSLLQSASAASPQTSAFIVEVMDIVL